MVLVTLIGWAALLRGVARILAPTWLATHAAPRLLDAGFVTAALVLTAIYGLTLTAFGFLL